LRTIILLTIRTLAVAALVFLFARPFLRPTGAATNADASKRAVLILDGSLSMRAVQQGVSLFSRAQAEAADVLRALESGSEAAVIVVGANPRPLLPALSRNIPALHDELVKTEATYELGNCTAALASGKQILGGVGTIYVFSDFQESNWKSIKELPAGINFRLRPVTREPVENSGITAVQIAPAVPVVGESAEIVCTVFNSTARPRKETVRLELGDFSQESSVSVPAFTSANAAFNVAFPTVGNFTGKASLAPDDLNEDNTRFLSVRVQKALQLLLISDSEGTDHRSAAFFVSRALVPSAQAAPGLSLIRRHSQDADRGALETADVFLVAAPAMLTGESVEIISRRVKEGAQLMVFLDGPTAPMLASIFPPPFQILRSVKSETGETLGGAPRKLFADTEAGDWGSFRFFRHLQTQTLEARKDDVVLSFGDGSAALAISAMERGSAVFVNLPLTPDGGDFIGSPTFPSLLHEMLRALRRGTEAQSLTPGNASTVEVPTPGDGPLTVLDSANKRVESKVISSGRITKLALPVLRQPGICVVKQSDNAIGAAAINIDGLESDTRAIPVEKLKTAIGSNVVVAQNEDDLLGETKNRPLWPQLAAAAAALLALEMLLLAVWRPSLHGGRKTGTVPAILESEVTR
jgi:hypothetical protein